MNIWNWIWQNKEWLFSGLGAILLTNIGSFIWGKKTGITIAGNKFINNYNYYNEKTKIDYTAGVQLSTGASGIEYIMAYDCLLTITAENCDLLIDDNLIKTLKNETFSYFLHKDEKFKINYIKTPPILIIYPTKN